MDRRGFFRIVGVSGAAAAAAGCGKTTEAILPYVIPAEHIVPGVATWFATVCRECPAGCGVLAKSREGRIVKLEGNPDHPVNRGALCARRPGGSPLDLRSGPHPGPARPRGGDLAPGAGRRRREAPRREDRGRAPGGRGPDRDADPARDRQPGTPGGRVAEGGRRPPPRRVRAVRPRGPPGGEPGRLRDRRDPVPRLRGRADDPLPRRGLPRDVDLAGGIRGGVPPGARASRGALRSRDPRRAALLDDGGQRRRVGREPPRRARRRSRSPCCASSSRRARSRPCRPRSLEALTAAARTVDVEAVGQAERGPGGQAEAPGRGPGEGRAEPRRVGRRGGERTGRRGRRDRREPPQLRPRERGPDGPLRAELDPGTGEPVRGRARPDEGDGPGRDRRPHREGREPGLHAPGARPGSPRRSPRCRSW